MANAQVHVDRQRLQEEVGRWLSGYRWQLYLVLTFARPPRPETVQKAAEGWYASVRAEYPRAYAYISADRGAELQRWNLHVLLGGLFEHAPPPEPFRTLGLERARAQAARWWRQWGAVRKAEPFEPRRGAASYVAADWMEPEVPGMLLGTPIRKAHQRRA